MTRGNRLEAVLWAEYDGRLGDLATDAETIRQAVTAADEAVVAGPLACEVCGFDFNAAYGGLGDGYIEVHHTNPVIRS